MNETLYIKLEQNIKVTEPEVFLGKIAQMWCKDKVTLSKCMAIKVANLQKEDGRYVHSVLDMITLIQQTCPNLEVENVGEIEFVIEYQVSSHTNILWEWTKVIGVFIIIFFGAAFAIMTFNNDVSVPDVFQKVYGLVTGQVSNGFTVMEIGYSIGLAVGIMSFYNHFSKKKKISDPTPLEVEMRLYEQDLYTTMIKNDSRDSGKDDSQKCGS